MRSVDLEDACRESRAVVCHAYGANCAGSKFTGRLTRQHTNVRAHRTVAEYQCPVIKGGRTRSG